MEPYKGYFISGSGLMTHRLGLTGMSAVVFTFPAPALQSWESRVFSFNGLPWTSKNWRNGSAWSLRGSLLMNACLSKNICGDFR